MADACCVSPLCARNSPAHCSTHVTGVNVHLALSGISFTRRHSPGPGGGERAGYRRAVGMIWVGWGRHRDSAPVVPARAEGGPSPTPPSDCLLPPARLPSNRPAPGLLIRWPAPAGRRIPIGCEAGSGPRLAAAAEGRGGAAGRGSGGAERPRWRRRSAGLFGRVVRRDTSVGRGTRVERRRRRSGTRCRREHGGRGLGFRRAGRAGPDRAGGKEGGGGVSRWRSPP